MFSEYKIIKKITENSSGMKCRVSVSAKGIHREPPPSDHSTGHCFDFLFLVMRNFEVLPLDPAFFELSLIRDYAIVDCRYMYVSQYHAFSYILSSPFSEPVST